MDVCEETMKSAKREAAKDAAPSSSASKDSKDEGGICLSMSPSMSGRQSDTAYREEDEILAERKRGARPGNEKRKSVGS